MLPALVPTSRAQAASIRSAPLGFMIHSLRDYVIDDFAGTLVTLATLPSSETPDDRRRQFAELNRIGERTRAAGLQLGLHTPNEL